MPTSPDTPASTNVSVFFEVEVSGSYDNLAQIGLTVTFYFDYYDGSYSENLFSPNRTVDLTTPGDGAPSKVSTTWTYTTPNANFTDGAYWVYVLVSNEYGESDPYSFFPFQVFVVQKREIPMIQACRFIPDPVANVSFPCGSTDPAAQAAPNEPVFFQVNVSASTDNRTVANLNVTFYFDYWSAVGVKNPWGGPNRTIQITTPGDGNATSVNTTWTYTEPNANFSAANGQYWVYVNVTNDQGDVNPSLASIPFAVPVMENREPYVSGLVSVNTVHGIIEPWDPVIPLAYENASVGDQDGDPVTVSWDWGDGNWTVETLGPLPVDRTVPVNVTHQYDASLFPLNESPRFVNFTVRLWVDDGWGHNVTRISIAEFSIAWDRYPTLTVRQPLPGSVWKVGEAVTMVGNVTDPENDPTTAFWDFDNRTDSTHTGDSGRNMDANGTTASHAYWWPGNYTIIFWASDGDKLLCLTDQYNCTGGQTHWRSFSIQIVVVDNRPPILGLSNGTTTVGEPVTLRASVFDWDGDNLTLRWVFGDGTPDAFNYTGNTSRVLPEYPALVQNHVYLKAGKMNFTVYVSDGNATVNLTRDVIVQSFNLPPVILNVVLSHANGTESANNTFRLGERFNLTVYAYDEENDTLNMTIEWSPGELAQGTINPRTASDCRIDNRSRKVCFVSFPHTYANIGGLQFQNYTVNVTLWDGQVYFRQNMSGGPPITLNHTKAWSLMVFITDYRETGLGPWDWWDYSTLAAVIGLPSLLVIRFGVRVRRERREG